MTKRPKALDTFPEGLWEEMKQVLLYHFGSFHLHPFRAPPDGGDFGQQLIHTQR